MNSNLPPLTSKQENHVYGETKYIVVNACEDEELEKEFSKLSISEVTQRVDNFLRKRGVIK